MRKKWKPSPTGVFRSLLYKFPVKQIFLFVVQCLLRKNRVCHTYNAALYPSSQQAPYYSSQCAEPIFIHLSIFTWSLQTLAGSARFDSEGINLYQLHFIVVLAARTQIFWYTCYKSFTWNTVSPKPQIKANCKQTHLELTTSKAERCKPCILNKPDLIQCYFT